MTTLDSPEMALENLRWGNLLEELQKQKGKMCIKYICLNITSHCFINYKSYLYSQHKVGKKKYAQKDSSESPQLSIVQLNFDF